MSASPPTAARERTSRHFAFGPLADMQLPLQMRPRSASEAARVDRRIGSNEIVDFASRNPDISELQVAQFVQRRSQVLADTPGTKSVKISPKSIGWALRRHGRRRRSLRNTDRASLSPEVTTHGRPCQGRMERPQTPASVMARTKPNNSLSRLSRECVTIDSERQSLTLTSCLILP
jgi:hypothetical protein